MSRVFSNQELHKALDQFRDKYNEGHTSFELAKLNLYSLLKKNEQYVDEEVEKRALNFIEVMRRKGKILELR